MQEISYDPETVAMLASVVNEAWDTLPLNRQRETTKSAIAVRILNRASMGERDPVRLWAYAVLAVVH